MSGVEFQLSRLKNERVTSVDLSLFESSKNLSQTVKDRNYDSLKKKQLLNNFFRQLSWTIKIEQSEGAI